MDEIISNIPLEKEGFPEFSFIIFEPKKSEFEKSL